MHELRQRCLETWIDLSDGQDIEFHVVKPNPRDVPNALAHIIITQGSIQNRCPLLLNTLALPPLQQNRAILQPVGSNVRDVFRAAQIPQACRSSAVFCQLEGLCDQAWVTYNDEDVVAFDSGAWIGGSIMALDDTSEESDFEQQDEQDEQSDATTGHGLSDLDEADTMSLVSMSSTAELRLFPHDVYPWEHQGLEEPQQDIVDELEEDDVWIEAHTMESMREHASRNRIDVGEDPGEWLVITFGLGVADLGRRDTHADITSIQDVEEKVRRLWADHAARGSLEIQFVQPQPILADEMSVVLIVVVRYDVDIDDAWRTVLVMEEAEFDFNPRHQPYAHFVGNRGSARTVAMDIGLQECYPMGTRDCQVFVRGQQLTARGQHQILDGSLCRMCVVPLKEFVCRGRQMISGFDNFYLSLRGLSEAREEPPRVCLRVHGITPRNIPLGHRDVYISVEDVAGMAWIEQIHGQWHFFEYECPRVHFAAQASALEPPDQQVPIFHFIVSYARGHAGKAILVRQRMVSEDGEADQVEMWAVMLDDRRDEHDVFAQLWRPPFWFHPIALSRLTRGGECLEEVDWGWYNGEMLDLRLIVPTRTEMLRVLMEIKMNTFDDSPVIDHVDLLQLSATQLNRKTPFHEVCLACLPQTANISNETEDDLNPRRCEQCSDVDNKVQERPETHENGDDPDVTSLREIVHSLLQEEWHGLSRDFTVVPVHHPAARLAVESTSQMNQTNNVFHVFTDGSVKGPDAAWAFVVLCGIRNAHGWSFVRIGYAGAKLVNQPGVTWTSCDAEAAAMVAMCDYLLSRPHIPGLELHCHFDAKAIGMSTFGLANIKQRGDVSSWTFRARVMMALVQRKFHCTPYHVHSHEGNPFNELTDGIAGWVRQGFDCPVVPILRTEQLFSHPLAAWAWLEVAPDEELPGLQQTLKNEPPQQDSFQPDQILRDRCHKQLDAGKKIWKVLTCATVNVGTMEYDAQCDIPVSMKSRELAHQFQENGWDIVFIQESRARNTCVALEGSYARIISAGCKGQAGVEIWIHIDQFRNKLDVEFDYNKDLMVWHSDARCLAVHLALPGCEVDLLSCYAPQRGRGHDDIKEWWEHFEHTVNKRTWRCPLWIAGDFNCSVGTIGSEEVGDLAPDIEDVGGEYLRKFAANHQCKVANTWSDIHQGVSWTYQGPRGGRSRIDYFLVSDECWDSVVSTQVDHDVELLNGDRDHSPLIMQFQFCLERGAKTGVKRVTKYDREAARNSHGTQIDLVHSISCIPWNVGTNDHWSRVRDELQSQAIRYYPKQKRQKRQNYLSEDGWALVCSRKDVRQQHRQQMRAMNFLRLKQCFQAWQGNLQESAYQPIFHLMQLQEAVTYEQRQRLDHAFRSKRRAEWRQWVKDVMTQKVNSLAKNSGVDLFRILQPKKMIAKHQGKARRLHPGLRDQQGQWCRSRQEIAIAWQKQFSQIENAVPVDPQEFVQLDGGHFGQVTGKQLQEVPTLFDLEWSLRNLNARKATGVDGIGAELLQTNISATAIRMYSLFLKTALRREWVPEMSGGWLLPLLKNRSDHHSMGNYRGILLEPVLARTFSRSWRGKLATGVHQLAEPNQWGGRAGLSCSALHLQLKMHQANNAAQSMSQALVFVDIRAAFYSVAKPLLYGQEYSDQMFLKVCNAMKIPESARDEFRKNVHETNAIGFATDSKIQEDMTRSSLHRTWFIVPDGNEMYAPMTGSRPGDPLADLFFSAIMAVMLQKIHERCFDQGIFADDGHGNLVGGSVTWVDDLAFSITSSAEELVSKILHLLSIIIDTTTEFGFQLSFGVGKTAVIPIFRGKKARESRIQCEQRCGQGFPVMTEHRGLIMVPLTHYYRHLGGFLNRQGTAMQELKVRAGQTISRMAALRKTLRDSRIENKHKQTLLKTMAWPVLSLHAGCWWNLTEGEFQTWQGAWHRVTQVMYPRDEQGEVQKVSTIQRALDAASPMPMEMLILHRLRLFAHILAENDHFMTDAVITNHRITHDGSWWNAVKGSLKWLERQIGSKSLVRECMQLQTMEDWGKLQTRSSRLKKYIKHAERAHMLRIRTFCDVSNMEKEQNSLLQEMGWKKEVRVTQQDGADTDFTCEKCGFQAKSDAALAVHAQRFHGERAAIRRFINDGVCRICRKMFHTRPRLLQHLHFGGKACWFKIMRGCVPMDEDTTKMLDSQDLQEGAALHQHGMRKLQQERACRSCTDDEMLSTLTWKSDPQQISEEEPTDEELQQWRQFGMLPPGRWGRKHTTRKETKFEVTDAVEDVQKLEHRLKQEVVLWQPAFDYIPRPFSQGQRYVLIFFAGHRRANDIADYLHHHSDLIPVSIDTSVSEKFGNVHDTHMWLQLIARRKVVGGHAGPPCETFSLARWLNKDQKGFPQPLRTAEYPWGLPALSSRELVQCVNGTSLFLKALFLLCVIHACGGGTTLEHPKGPEQDAGHPGWAIWLSSFIQKMLLDSAMGLVTFAQGPLGKAYTKPTRLLVGRMRFLAGDIYSAYDLSWRPSMWLGGKNADGTWRTSEAKMYPAKLCEVIAWGFIKHSQSIASDGHEDDPENLQDALEELARVFDPDMDQGHMKADFQLRHFK